MTTLPIVAVVPVKDLSQAKQRLAAAFPAPVRRRLILALFENLLAVLSQARGLAGVVVVTADPDAARLAKAAGADVWTDGAHDGHTGAVTAAARRLAREGKAMLTLPADLPLIAPQEIERLIEASVTVPGFVIAPAHDQLGSNGVLVTPADAVPLRFGPDSFFPHLAAARAAGIEPVVMPLPGFALDIDTPEDLAEVLRHTLPESVERLLARHDVRLRSEAEA